ncbi:MAG: 50S ribosomal protein L18 [Candidatus Tectomicrobia bacterium]|nr:50S ribosomal protein L18 [Candidatus Tectomicrobia bacterium]
MSKKQLAWQARKARVRSRVKGTSERPRVTVFRSGKFRSGKHIYAQLIDDRTGRTVVAASSLEEEFGALAKAAEKAHPGNRAGAAIVGKILGGRAKAQGVAQVVFDRNGYLYHGRVKALADGVRETGVKF